MNNGIINYYKIDFFELPIQLKFTFQIFNMQFNEYNHVNKNFIFTHR